SFAGTAEDVEVHALMMAPAGAADTIRKVLAMGADAATHVVDEGLRGADIGLTAEVIAAALERIGYDLVIAGNQSTDGLGGVLPAMLSEKLGVPAATELGDVAIEK